MTTNALAPDHAAARTAAERRTWRSYSARLMVRTVTVAMLWVVLVGGLGYLGLWIPSLLVDDTCPADSTMLVPVDPDQDPGMGLPGAAGDGGYVAQKRVPGCAPATGWFFVSIGTAVVGGLVGGLGAGALSTAWREPRPPEWYTQRQSEYWTSQYPPPDADSQTQPEPHQVREEVVAAEDEDEADDDDTDTDTDYEYDDELDEVATDEEFATEDEAARLRALEKARHSPTVSGPNLE